MRVDSLRHVSHLAKPTAVCAIAAVGWWIVLRAGGQTLISAQSDDFMPHGYCFLWNPLVLWLHVISDSLIVVSYFCIPLALVYLVRKRRDLPFNWIFWMFGVFILGCGTTHFMEVWTVWHPAYLLAGAIKAVTAAASVATAIALIPLIPKAVALPSPRDLQVLNDELRLQVDQREQAEGTLRETLAAREKTLSELAERQATVEDLEQAREELQVNKDRLNAIVQSAMDAIIAIDTCQRVVIFNTAAQKMFGYSAEEGVGMMITEFIPERFRAQHAAHVRNFGQTGATSRAMGRLGMVWGRRRTGEEFPIEASISHVETSGKKLFTVILRDVTERERTQSHVNRLAAIVESCDDAIMSTDLKGKVITWNHAAERLYGYTAAEAEGKPIAITVPSELQEEAARLLQEVAQGNRVSHHETIRRRKDESLVNVSLNISPIWDSHGQIVGISKIGRDITERKRTEEQLREQARTLDLATVLVRNKDGYVTYWSQGAQELYGYSPEEAIGRISHELFRTKFPVSLRDLEETLAEKGQWEGELEHRKKDGSQVFVASMQKVYRDENSNKVRVLEANTDITARREAERRLAEQADKLTRQAAELARSNRDLEQFAYVASHDLQEPLRMVAVYTQLLGERYQGKLDENADKYIGYARDGATRMQTLIQDLLAFSRVGRNGASRAPVDCGAAVRQALNNLDSAIRDSGAVVTFGELPVVWAARMPVEQVFQNLIGNGLKFRKKEETPQIQVAAEKTGEFWQFTVADNGIGIAPEHAENIFAVFQRLHTRSEYPGNGIGLAICRKAVEYYGGKIWVESQPGQGAAFKFTLPAGNADGGA
jgi:PAS domain S-box-containing protein